MASPLLVVPGGDYNRSWSRCSNGQDVQMFIDDQQGQILIITVVVDGATGQHLRSKCQLAFNSRAFRGQHSRCGRERERARGRERK